MTKLVVNFTGKDESDDDGNTGSDQMCCHPTFMSKNFPVLKRVM